jgi:O-methyltransferase
MIRFIEGVFELLGYEINITKKSNSAGNGFAYSLIRTTATYSPWLQDSDFAQAYSIVNSYTLVDIYRCHELWSLVEEADKLPGVGSFLEVGVWRGGTSGLIGKRLQLLGSNSILYSADTFRGVVKSSIKDSVYIDGEHNDTNTMIVQDLLEQRLYVKNFRILRGVFPDETGKLIPLNEMFKFCHIDVDVYQSAVDILDWIWERLDVGAIIVFDDYGFRNCDGITKYLNERRKKTDCIFIYNVTGQGILIKLGFRKGPKIRKPAN